MVPVERMTDAVLSDTIRDIVGMCRQAACPACIAIGTICGSCIVSPTTQMGIDAFKHAVQGNTTSEADVQQLLGASRQMRVPLIQT